jgi:radical SAM superfamily enzyme YgiQ (UPF0313 family)
VAPEHAADEVLHLMRKPSFRDFEKFHNLFREVCRRENLPWQLVPYFISGHPGCQEVHAGQVTRAIRNLNQKPELVQQFTPTPMTLATTMYFTGLDPYSGKKVYTATSDHLKRQQKRLFQKTIKRKKIIPAFPEGAWPQKSAKV